MPIGSRGAPVFIAGRGLSPIPMAKLSLPFNQPARYRLYGVTKNSAGAVLGGCIVEVHETAEAQSDPTIEPRGQLRGSTVSDASGNYSLDVTSGADGRRFQVKAYLAGAPDVAGVTVNTLQGEEL